MGGADDGGQADNHNGSEHDPVHDDPRRRGGPGGVRIHPRAQRRPVRTEGPGGDPRHPGQGIDGDIHQG